MPINRKQARGIRILEMVFGCFFILSVIYLSKSVETVFFPVIDNFEIEKIKEGNNNEIVISGKMDKVRSCKPNNFIVYSSKNDDELPRVIDYDFNASNKKYDGKLLNRAALNQKWGPWTLSLNDTETQTHIYLYASYSCHALYDTSKMIHGFSVKRKENNILTLGQ